MYELSCVVASFHLSDVRIGLLAKGANNLVKHFSYLVADGRREEVLDSLDVWRSITEQITNFVN